MLVEHFEEQTCYVTANYNYRPQPATFHKVCGSSGSCFPGFTQALRREKAFSLRAGIFLGGGLYAPNQDWQLNSISADKGSDLRAD